MSLLAITLIGTLMAFAITVRVAAPRPRRVAVPAQTRHRTDTGRTPPRH